MHQDVVLILIPILFWSPFWFCKLIEIGVNLRTPIFQADFRTSHIFHQKEDAFFSFSALASYFVAVHCFFKSFGKEILLKAISLLQLSSSANSDEELLGKSVH